MQRNFDKWIIGYEAYDKGDELYDNPHKEGSDEHSVWESGWFAAMDDENYRRKSLEE